MKTLASGTALLLAACFLALPACGQKKEAPEKSGSAPSAARPAGDSAKRFSDSINVLQKAIDEGTLDFHLSFKGERNVNPKAAFDEKEKPVIGPVTIEADLKGDELHAVYTSGGKKEEHRGKRSEKDKGMDWSLAQLAVIGPLLETNLAMAVASAGVKSAGSDMIEGRSAERFELAPATAADVSRKAAEGIVQGFVAIKNVKGTVSVDKETGGLLKLDIEYETGDRKENAWKQHDAIVVTGLKKR